MVRRAQTRLRRTSQAPDVAARRRPHLGDVRVRPRPHHRSRARAVYRINRDTRFSDDKSPYKTHIAAIFPHRKLSKNSGASFYFNVSPERVEVAAGIYTPESSELRRIRQRLLAGYERFGEIVSRIDSSRLVGDLQGEKLKRVPRGFPSDHPAQELLRYKQLYYDVHLPAHVAGSHGLFDEVSKRFRALAPLVGFLDECLISNESSAAL